MTRKQQERLARRIRIGLIVVLFSVAGIVFARSAFAADPLPLQIADGQAFRHVLETDDWLFLGRMYKNPATSIGNTDSFTVTTTSGAFDDPIALTNKVDVTTAADFIVTETGVPTVLTAFCTLGEDDQTIDCTGTGLADSTYTIEVEYRMGWDAYLASDAFFRVFNSPTVLAGRSSPNGNYTLAGLYLTAAEVTALGATWGDAAILIQALASPNLWNTPADVTAPITTWHRTATVAATVPLLTTAVQSYLITLENDDPDVAAGTYVGTAGITLTGSIIAARAFSRIQSAIPQAFSSFEVNVVPTVIATPAKSVVDALDTIKTSTSVYITFQGIHPAIGGALVFVLSLGAAGGLWVKFKSSAVAGSSWLGIFVAGWLTFNIPFQLVFFTLAVLVALGFLFIGKVVFD